MNMLYKTFEDLDAIARDHGLADRFNVGLYKTFEDLDAIALSKWVSYLK